MQNYYRVVDKDITSLASAKLPWDRLNGKTVLITGANGYICSYIVYTLIKRNELFNANIKIICLCRNEERARGRFANIWNREDVSFLIQDVAVKVEIDKEINVIIHGASSGYYQALEQDPVGILRANVIGTNNLLELAREKHVDEFLFLSSAAVYHTTSCGERIKEETVAGFDAMNYLNCYAIGKKTGEILCQSYRKQHNIPVKVVRPFKVYGPGMAPEQGKAVMEFAQCIVDNKDIHLRSYGGVINSYCYISDVVEGIFTVLLKGKNAEAYNISSEQDLFSLEELAKVFVRECSGGILRVIESGTKPIQRKALVPNIEKIRELGWTQKIDIVEGIKRTVESIGSTD